MTPRITEISKLVKPLAALAGGLWVVPRAARFTSCGRGFFQSSTKSRRIESPWRESTVRRFLISN
jgi:hypothetical protein